MYQGFFVFCLFFFRGWVYISFTMLSGELYPLVTHYNTSLTSSSTVRSSFQHIVELIYSLIRYSMYPHAVTRIVVFLPYFFQYCFEIAQLLFFTCFQPLETDFCIFLLPLNRPWDCFQHSLKIKFLRRSKPALLLLSRTFINNTLFISLFLLHTFFLTLRL